MFAVLHQVNPPICRRVFVQILHLARLAVSCSGRGSLRDLNSVLEAVVEASALWSCRRALSSCSDLSLSFHSSTSLNSTPVLERTSNALAISGIRFSGWPMCPYAIAVQTIAFSVRG